MSFRSRRLRTCLVQAAVSARRLIVFALTAALLMSRQASALTVPLGNLFDDSKATSLGQAVTTDTYGAEAGEDDLGVRYLDRDLSRPIRIGSDQLFNLVPAGGTNLWADPVLNDVSIVPGNWPIRTTGERFSGDASKVEDGIGMHANNSNTFDLDEIRTASGFGLDHAMRFTASGAVNDTAVRQGGEFRLAAILLGNGTPKAFVSGRQYPVKYTDGAWEFESVNALPILNGLGASFSLFDVPIAADDTYLSLASISMDSHTADHAVFSNAMLVIENPGDTNADGIVDLEDLNNVRNNFGGIGLGDTNDDGIVDLVDLNNVRNHFGESAAPTSVPEPATFILAAIMLTAGLTMPGRRCRRCS